MGTGLINSGMTGIQVAQLGLATDLAQYFELRYHGLQSAANRPGQQFWQRLPVQVTLGKARIFYDRARV